MALYDPSLEKDNCGFGLIAHMEGEQSHKLVRTAISALDRMTHRGGIAAECVRVLPEFAVLQAERPDVVDVAVAGHVGIERLIRVRRRGGEGDRVRVHVLGRGIVVRAEGDLCLGAGGRIDLEELFVAAHTRHVDDRAPVGRPGGATDAACRSDTPLVRAVRIHHPDLVIMIEGDHRTVG